MKHLVYILIVLSSCSILGCKHKPQVQPDATPLSSNFPSEIESILVNRCATSGCHNVASYTAAGGLLLDSWDHLFNGGSNGAVVVPYNADNSSLLYFVNTYPDLGTTAEPTMPYNDAPLTKDEYELLKQWINNGAPDKNGNIPFAENATSRQKIYMVQQGCDLVAVIDAERHVVMRYISVGADYGTENPNNIIISPDCKYAYVSFWNANLIQKIDTDIDSVVATLETPRAFQKSIALNSDGSKLIACNWYSQDIILVNTVSMQIEKNYGQDIRFVGGFTATSSGGFYATSQFGNTIYKINPDGSYLAYSIDAQQPVQETSQSTPDPYRILMSPNQDKLFITCTNTNELRVVSTTNHQVLYTIPVGHNPSEMALSTADNYLFVSCSNDTLGALDVGSVYVIDYNTGKTVKVLRQQFFQPNGIAVDNRNNLLFVFSRNEDKNGPPPHHSSPCNGRNGFYQIFDLKTLAPANNKRFEVTVDPYMAATRF